MIPKERHGKWRERKSKAEREYDKFERERFRNQFPEAALQSELVRKMARQLAPLQKGWRKAGKNAATARQQLENVLSEIRPGRINLRQLKKLVLRMQNRGIRAIEEEQDFFGARESLMRYYWSKTDYRAQQTAFALEYDKAAIEIEKQFFGQMKMLSETKRLGSFAELIARMNVGKDEKYKSLRQSIAGITKADAKSASDINDHLDRLRWAFDQRIIGRKKYFTTVLRFELMEAQHKHWQAELEEALYLRLQGYAKEMPLNRFLAMLAREKKAEKKYFCRREGLINKLIAREKER